MLHSPPRTPHAVPVRGASGSDSDIPEQKPIQRRTLALGPVPLDASLLARFLQTLPCRWPFQHFLPVLGPCSLRPLATGLDVLRRGFLSLQPRVVSVLETLAAFPPTGRVLGLWGIPLGSFLQSFSKQVKLLANCFHSGGSHWLPYLLVSLGLFY